MKFDRNASGGGLEITITVQNGKAMFQCMFFFEVQQEVPDCDVELRIWDRENRLVFRGCHPAGNPEPLKGMILHPHLWQGSEDSYLYRVQAVLISPQIGQQDLLERNLGFYHLHEIPMKGWFLNERPIEIRAVKYELFNQEVGFEKEETKIYEEQLRRNLQLIRDMGANGIFTDSNEKKELLHEICEELGLIVWKTCGENMPQFHEIIQNGFLTDCYYYHKACWTREPFVYISKESLSLEKGGTVRVTVYSNQPKVALYAEGELFEFRREGPDFVFEGIPIKQLPIMLTAETGACSMSLSEYPVHKMFTI